MYLVPCSLLVHFANIFSALDLFFFVTLIIKTEVSTRSFIKLASLVFHFISTMFHLAFTSHFLDYHNPLHTLPFCHGSSRDSVGLAELASSARSWFTALSHVATWNGVESSTLFPSMPLTEWSVELSNPALSGV